MKTLIRPYDVTLIYAAYAKCKIQMAYAAYAKIRNTNDFFKEKVCKLQHWINYTLHFVDLTGFYTQIIESYWNRCETKIKAMEGIQRDMLPGYLNEFM